MDSETCLGNWLPRAAGVGAKPGLDNPWPVVNQVSVHIRGHDLISTNERFYSVQSFRWLEYCNLLRMADIASRFAIVQVTCSNIRWNDLPAKFTVARREMVLKVRIKSSLRNSHTLASHFMRTTVLCHLTQAVEAMDNFPGCLRCDHCILKV